MNNQAKAYLVGVVWGVMVGVFAILAFNESPKLDIHIDAEHNVICYTYRETMQCFPYVDQGTHLEITEPKLAL